MKPLPIAPRLLLTVGVLVGLLSLILLAAQPLDADTLSSHLQPGPVLGRLAASPTANSALGGAPLLFVENVGQFPGSVRYQALGTRDGSLLLVEDGLWLSLVEQPVQGSAKTASVDPHGLSTRRQSIQADSQAQSVRGVGLKLSFLGANPHPQIEPFARQYVHLSYVQGKDPTSWHSDVPVWGGVRYKDLYPGVDLEVQGADGTWSWRAVIHEGADLSAVRLKVAGARGLDLVADGSSGPLLRAKSDIGEFGLPLLDVAPEAGVGLESLGLQSQGMGSQSVPVVLDDEVRSPFAPGASGADRKQASSSSQALSATGTLGLTYSSFLGGLTTST